MKTLFALILLLSNYAQAECFVGLAKAGSVRYLKQDATLYFQRAGSKAAMAIVLKNGGEIHGDVRCEGKSPDYCVIGQNGERATFQFVDNVPKFVATGAKLNLIGDDAEEQDLRLAKDQGNYDYPFANEKQEKCASMFPQLKDAELVPQAAKPAAQPGKVTKPTTISR